MKLLLVLLALPLNGCLWLVAGGAAEGGYVASQKTGAKTTVNDQWITTQVKAGLISDEKTQARHISVTTVEGVVTLRGFASTAEEKRRAVEVARGVEGVKKVVDTLSVTP